jgi:transposase
VMHFYSGPLIHFLSGVDSFCGVSVRSEPASGCSRGGRAERSLVLLDCPEGVLGVDGEVVVERRRQWTPEQKAALLGEVEAEGGQVSVVARRRGVSTSLLYNWRSAWKAAAMAAQSTAVRPAEFVQLGVVADATGESPRVPMAAGAVCPRGAGLALAERVGVIEIDLPDGVRVRIDNSVNEKALRRVLSALRGSG